MAIKKLPSERKPPRKRAPEGETKEQRFVRLATVRVNKVRKALDQVGQLGATNYSSTDLQREKIIDALRESLEFNINRLSKVKLSKSNFSLT